jgi:sigma-B regulation protein RsbU (phosphoserine phosphatase)
MDRTSNKAPITNEDISTLLSILNQTAIILDNIFMYNALEHANNDLNKANKQLKVVNKELRNANAKINRDLKHARSIQQGLLPQQIPDTPVLSIKATYIPAAAVSGDYYDVFEIDPGIFGIIIADVSGHGVSSALIMTMVKVLLKTFVHSCEGPQQTLEKINDIFMTELNTDHFVTVFYAVLNMNTNQIHYTSAGHCPVIFLNKVDKTCTKIKADGLFLGVFPDMMLKETTNSFNPGTYRVVLYTDGFTEARNEKGEMFELERLENIALETLQYSPEKAFKKILANQKKFCGKNIVAGDDITMLVIDF